MQNRVPWAAVWSAALGYSTNDKCRSELCVANYCPKNLFPKISVVHNSCFQLQVSHCYS